MLRLSTLTATPISFTTDVSFYLSFFTSPNMTTQPSLPPLSQATLRPATAPTAQPASSSAPSASTASLSADASARIAQKASLLATLLQQFHSSSSARNIPHSPHQPPSTTTQSIDGALSHLLYLQQYLASLSAHLRALRSQPPATCPYLDLIQRIVGMVVHAPTVPGSAQFITAPTPPVLRPSSAHTTLRPSTAGMAVGVGVAAAAAGGMAAASAVDEGGGGGPHFISGVGGGGSVRSAMRAPSGVSFVHGRWQSIDGLKEHEDDTVNELDAIDDWNNNKTDNNNNNNTNNKAPTTAAEMELKATIQPPTAALAAAGRQRKKSWSQVVEAAEVGLADVEESDLDESKLTIKLQQQKQEQQRAVAYVNGRWTGMEEKVEGSTDGRAVLEDETIDELDNISDFDDDPPINSNNNNNNNNNASTLTSASHSSISLSSMSVLGTSTGSSVSSSPRSLQNVLDAMSDDSSRLSSAAVSRQHSRQSSRNAPLSTLQRAVAKLDERKEVEEVDEEEEATERDEGVDETWEEGQEDSTAVNVERSRIRDEDVNDVADVSEDADAGRLTRAQQLTADEMDDIEAFEALQDDDPQPPITPHAQPETAAAAAGGAGRGERELNEFEVDDVWTGCIHDEERQYTAVRHGGKTGGVEQVVHSLSWDELGEYVQRWHEDRDGSEMDDIPVWVDDEDDGGEGVGEDGEEGANEGEEETDGLDDGDGLSDVDDELEQRLASRQTAAAVPVAGSAEDEEEDWGE